MLSPPAALQPVDLRSLLTSLGRPGTLAELALLAACLLLAWGGVRLLRGPQRRPGSVWFGEGVVDGVLFPVLALLLASAVRFGLAALDVPPVVFGLALPVLLSLMLIRLGVRVLRVAFPASQTVRVVERTLSWGVWLWLALWLTGLLPTVLKELESIHWTVGSSQVSLRSLVEGSFNAALVLVLVLWVSAAVEARLLKGGATANLSLRKIAANVVRAGLLFVGLMLALSAAGIDLTALGVLGGALGVGLGFGLQKLAANYVSGFVILAERSLRIGDVVKVDNFEGRITDINTRYTVIRAFDGRESIVPNELLITQRIENSSLADPNVLLGTQLLVAYGTELDALMPQLITAIGAVPRVLAEPQPWVRLENFAADGLALRIGFWIADPHNGHGNVCSDVNLALLRVLNALGIEIPFPQRVLHRHTRRS